jgi:hypothetical protein
MARVEQMPDGQEDDQAFGYWFDFGDDWWHQINVVAVEEKVPKGKCPKVTKRVGKSPPCPQVLIRCTVFPGQPGLGGTTPAPAAVGRSTKSVVASGRERTWGHNMDKDK